MAEKVGILGSMLDELESMIIKLELQAEKN